MYDDDEETWKARLSWACESAQIAFSPAPVVSSTSFASPSTSFAPSPLLPSTSSDPSPRWLLKPPHHPLNRRTC